MLNIEERRSTFEVWQKELPLRIQKWEEFLKSLNVELCLDYSKESLSELERILLDKYDSNAYKEKILNTELDGAASYIGESIKALIPGSDWTIFLDDETNIYFGLPCVLTNYSGAISIHFLIREILTERSGNVLNERLKAVIDYESFIKSQLDQA